MKIFGLSILVYDLNLKAYFSFDIAASSICIFLWNMCKSPYIYIYNSSVPQTHFLLVYTALIKLISPVAVGVW